MNAAARAPSLICLGGTRCTTLGSQRPASFWGSVPVRCIWELRLEVDVNDKLFCLNRWSSTAPSHPTWRSPRHRRSLANGRTAGPTLCSDWASLQSSSWPRWEETSLQSQKHPYTLMTIGLCICPKTREWQCKIYSNWTSDGEMKQSEKNWFLNPHYHYNWFHDLPKLFLTWVTPHMTFQLVLPLIITALSCLSHIFSLLRSSRK